MSTTVVNLMALEAVKRGMEWLDKNYPGWRCRMDAETLTLNGIGSDQKCAYAQATGLTYTHACIHEPELHDVGVRASMGFTINTYASPYNIEQLEDAWKYALMNPS